MQIVFTKEVADQLREKYTLLQLDTIQPDGYGEVETYCVLEPENIVMEMGSLPDNVSKHNQLVEALENEDCNRARDLCRELMGKFGGDLDSFYEVVIDRIDTHNRTKFLQIPS